MAYAKSLDTPAFSADFILIIVIVSFHTQSLNTHTSLVAIEKECLFHLAFNTLTTAFIRQISALSQSTPTKDLPVHCRV